MNEYYDAEHNDDVIEEQVNDLPLAEESNGISVKEAVGTGLLLVLAVGCVWKAGRFIKKKRMRYKKFCEWEKMEYQNTSDIVEDNVYDDDYYDDVEFVDDADEVNEG